MKNVSIALRWVWHIETEFSKTGPIAYNSRVFNLLIWHDIFTPPPSQLTTEQIESGQADTFNNYSGFLSWNFLVKITKLQKKKSVINFKFIWQLCLT